MTEDTDRALTCPLCGGPVDTRAIGLTGETILTRCMSPRCRWGSVVSPPPDAAGAPPTEAEIDLLIDRTRASWARAEDHYPASLDGFGHAAAVREANAAHAVIIVYDDAGAGPRGG